MRAVSLYFSSLFSCLQRHVNGSPNESRSCRPPRYLANKHFRFAYKERKRKKKWEDRKSLKKKSQTNRSRVTAREWKFSKAIAENQPASSRNTIVSRVMCTKHSIDHLKILHLDLYPHPNIHWKIILEYFANRHFSKPVPYQTHKTTAVEFVEFRRKSTRDSLFT